MKKFREEHGYSSEGLFLFLQPQGTVLEVGCGSGRNLIYMADRRFKVLGIDISRERLEEMPYDIQRIRADALAIPFKEDSFDCVLCTELLEHLESPNSCISEVKRILKKGGIAVFACPTLNIPYRGLIPIYRRLAGIPSSSFREHVHVFSTKQLADMLSHHFQIVAVKHVDFASTILERRLGISCGIDAILSLLSKKIPLLEYLSGGVWFKVRKMTRATTS